MTRRGDGLVPHPTGVRATHAHGCSGVNQIAASIMNAAYFAICMSVFVLIGFEEIGVLNPA